jgi:ribosome maturation factor RimP
VGSCSPFFVFKYLLELKVMDIEETVWNILTEPIKGLGYNLIRVKTIGSKKLQIMAERSTDNGLDINDCVKISKFASVLFEKENTINFDFALEVSSPGINRPLIKIDDYRNHLGSYVDIKLKKIINKKRKISGKIINLQNEKAIQLKQNKQTFLIPFNIISECNLDPNYL